MIPKIFRAAALALASIILVAGGAWAGSEDYEFQLVGDEIRQGNAAVIAVRLVDKRTGAPVDDAVVFATRMDMAPDGMEAMTTPVALLPPELPGVYRFGANLVMAGGWRLSIAAKVQGEIETVTGKLTFQAAP